MTERLEIDGVAVDLPAGGLGLRLETGARAVGGVAMRTGLHTLTVRLPLSARNAAVFGTGQAGQLPARQAGGARPRRRAVYWQDGALALDGAAVVLAVSAAEVSLQLVSGAAELAVALRGRRLRDINRGLPEAEQRRRWWRADTMCAWHAAPAFHGLAGPDAWHPLGWPLISRNDAMAPLLAGGYPKGRVLPAVFVWPLLVAALEDAGHAARSDFFEGIHRDECNPPGTLHDPLALLPGRPGDWGRGAATLRARASNAGTAYAGGHPLPGGGLDPRWWPLAMAAVERDDYAELRRWRTPGVETSGSSWVLPLDQPGLALLRFVPSELGVYRLVTRRPTGGTTPPAVLFGVRRIVANVVEMDDYGYVEGEDVETDPVTGATVFRTSWRLVVGSLDAAAVGDGFAVVGLVYGTGMLTYSVAAGAVSMEVYKLSAEIDAREVCGDELVLDLLVAVQTLYNLSITAEPGRVLRLEPMLAALRYGGDIGARVDRTEPLELRPAAAEMAHTHRFATERDGDDVLDAPGPHVWRNEGGVGEAETLNPYPGVAFGPLAGDVYGGKMRAATFPDAAAELAARLVCLRPEEAGADTPLGVYEDAHYCGGGRYLSEYNDGTPSGAGLDVIQLPRWQRAYSARDGRGLDWATLAPLYHEPFLAFAASGWLTAARAGMPVGAGLDLSRAWGLDGLTLLAREARAEGGQVELRGWLGLGLPAVGSAAVGCPDCPGGPWLGACRPVAHAVGVDGLRHARTAAPVAPGLLAGGDGGLTIHVWLRAAADASGSDLQGLVMQAGAVDANAAGLAMDYAGELTLVGNTGVGPLATVLFPLGVRLAPGGWHLVSVHHAEVGGGWTRAAVMVDGRLAGTAARQGPWSTAAAGPLRLGDYCDATTAAGLRIWAGALAAVAITTRHGGLDRHRALYADGPGCLHLATEQVLALYDVDDAAGSVISGIPANLTGPNGLTWLTR